MTFKVTIPASSAGLNVSTAVKAVAFELTGVVSSDGTAYRGALDTSLDVPVAAGSPNCVLASNGDNTCTVTANEPAPGVDTFSVFTFAVTNPVIGTTVPLSTMVGYSIPVSLSAANDASVSTSGVPASLAFSPASVTVAAGTPLSQSTALATQLLVLGASGSALIGNAAFTNSAGISGAVQMTGCDPHLTATPSVLSATTPSQLDASAITIAYDGAVASGALSCYASGPGGVTATYTVHLVAAPAGGITIVVPPPQPVLCAPAPLTLGVAQRAVETCTSAGFDGAIAFTVADPTIATVQLVAGTDTLFYVFGMQIGTTTVAFQTASGGTGQLPITVSP